MNELLPQWAVALCLSFIWAFLMALVVVWFWSVIVKTVRFWFARKSSKSKSALAEKQDRWNKKVFKQGERG
ncbi:MAG: hypothetical protein HWN68_18315 [Desulfobacterales bacterium]|nr:hypothetical protein [Desulfobacterales bacterium]